MRRTIADALRQAVAVAEAHPLRSALGALAMATAVAALTLVDIAFGGLEEFARRSAARAFGSETFVVAQVASAGRVTRRELARMLERNPPIRRGDLRFLEHYAGSRVVYAPLVQRSADLVASNRKFENATVAGAGAALPELRDLGITSGRFFLPLEERRAAFLAVIGHEVATRLFPGGDSLGQTVRIGGRAFLVIGVQSRLGQLGGASLDRYVFVPYPAFERIFGPAPTLQISARPQAGVSVEAAEDHARASLRARRQLRPGEEDNFDVLTPAAARGFVLNLIGRIRRAAPPISVMALLAAIVVVTNTTLVSVTERTREIGVRRAVGASRGQVLLEVLTESSLVAVVGGTVGALAAAAIAIVVSLRLDFAVQVESATLVRALLASAAAGLAAGWYPARRATRTDIVAALRIE